MTNSRFVAVTASFPLISLSPPTVILQMLGNRSLCTTGRTGMNDGIWDRASDSEARFIRLANKEKNIRFSVFVCYIERNG
jgi:hypothetical protein